ncbi:mediator complex subunit 13 C-terminal-domain-containing protein [Lobosporangium transversale]|uniref:Mediator of RNA polymerase II transcription subunit 13 n=1 Tax=Lobosporangium transversale TaxID=64571 RepID=A0A1Y2GUZ3_9FUNG|nr:mediator complex subunit 13 C-terminal-domain-containing protein [Lobosporangium transversale]ORZ24883.1 mediator complex subunit 13 C-terminal-domain-containing protein [Lobosporangium transversale]|eukprot:XP_021883864.1 mediator complex subunit 13 C-terminal-domain-containing protein [Lobosporangium transversale]
MDQSEGSQTVWNNVSIQGSDIGSSFGNTTQFNSGPGNEGNTTSNSVQVDNQVANAVASNASYQLSIDMQNDNSDMMSGLMDMNSMLGLYGGADDLGDWDEVTKDDFSFFDEAGGRYVYRRLYKCRRSSIPNPFNQQRRPSRMLPFYQPGKDQEWIMPAKKEKPRKTKSRMFSISFNWNSVKWQDQASKLETIKQNKSTSEKATAGNIPTVSATAWGISTLSLQQPAKRKMEESSSSDSDSDSTSTWSEESDDDTAVEPNRPAFGKLSRRFYLYDGNGHANAIRNSNGINKEAQEPWSARGINSAKFTNAVLTQSLDQSVGGALLGLRTSSTTHTQARGVTPSLARLDRIAPFYEHQRSKPWSSAEAYHAEVEFDTPFTPAVLSAAPPALVDEPLVVQDSLASEYFLEAVKTLCEQAVMGDYPFAGSNEVTGTSGEISEGESFHVMLARRKAMSELLRTGIATVPALGDESFRNIMEMKSFIFELFDHLRGNQSENTVALPIPSDASQDMTMSMATIHGHHHHSSQNNISPPVVMKGPLTLFQYFSLAEAQQMPSKYGKYPVKKKKPAEPSLVQLQPPDIVVGHNEEWLEAAPTILRFWEKLSLEPYSAKKNISYFVVYPEGDEMESSVIYPSTFGGYLRFGLRDIAFTVYTKCKLFLERPTYSEGIMAQINSYAPSFALARTTPVMIQYDVNLKPNSTPKPPATMHVGYGFSLDGRWLVCVWTDHRGEMLEHMALDMMDSSARLLTIAQPKGGQGLLSNYLHEIWTRTLVYKKRGSFSWKTIVCKLGLMTRVELQEWARLVCDDNDTAITAVNIDSPLRMYPHSRGAEYLSSNMTSGVNGSNTPIILGIGQTGASVIGAGPMGLNTTNPTATLTPDVSTAPATPSNSGVTGLGIVGTGSNPSGTTAGTSSTMSGANRLSGSEVLENSVGQVYAMILNHRIPLIVSHEETAFRIPALAQSGLSTLRTESGNEFRRSPEESKGDISTEDDLLREHIGADLSMNQNQNQNQSQSQDIKTHLKMKVEELDQQWQQKELRKEMDQDTKAPSTRLSLPLSDNDVILPLSTGYLIQVPTQANSVMREKHSLEALGIEVHLLHLQRTTSPLGPASAPASATNTPIPSVSTGTLLSNYNANLPYQQSSPSYHLPRHSAVANTNTSVSGQPYRSPSFASIQYPGSPLVGSSPSSTLPGGHSQQPHQQQQQQQQTSTNNGVGATTIETATAANTTREILKQFHALSHLSMSPVQTNCLPHHLILVERLTRVLLLVQDA